MSITEDLREEKRMVGLSEGGMDGCVWRKGWIEGWWMERGREEWMNG